MNKDLMQKLARLANNNPNENEANLAARKLVRMLEEGGFKTVDNESSGYTPPKQSDPREVAAGITYHPRDGCFTLKVTDLELNASRKLGDAFDEFRREYVKLKKSPTVSSTTTSYTSQSKPTYKPDTNPYARKGPGYWDSVIFDESPGWNGFTESVDYNVEEILKAARDAKQKGKK